MGDWVMHTFMVYLHRRFRVWLYANNVNIPCIFFLLTPASAFVVILIYTSKVVGPETTSSCQTLIKHLRRCE